MSANGILGQHSPSVADSSVLDETKPVATPAKRKNDDVNGGAQQRAKRNRYIAIACNECKRRKIKCNGETPCQRCGNLSLECVYAPNCCSSAFKDSDEYRHITQQLQSLQEQVNTLYASINDIHVKQNTASVAPEPAPQPAALTPLDPQFAAFTQGDGLHRRPDQNSVRQYANPPAPAFFIDQTNGGLRTMGVSQDGSEEGCVSAPKPVINPSSVDDANQPPIIKDPLWRLSQEEGLRLCQVYKDEMWSLCPIFDFNKVTSKARTMFCFLESMRKVGLMKKESERGDSFYDDETMIFKMMLACAAVAEGHGQTELGASLFENVRRIINGDDRMGKPATVTSIQLFALIAMYYFLLDDELQSYRFIGLAARQCFELGLHRQEVIASLPANSEILREAIRAFWITYVLDRRWSFGTGMPFAMPEQDMDPRLPDADIDVPYLKTMVMYSRIASKVWSSVSAIENTGLDPKMSDISWLDWQISQWQSSTPSDLRFSTMDFAPASEDLTRTQRRLRLILYLRANQLRIQLYRPVLYTVPSLLENRGYAGTAIGLAKDSIRTLHEIGKTTDVFTTHTASFYYFLVTALTVLFIAVAHAPLEFGRDVRDEFYLGLELVKVMGCKAFVAKRLWRTIRSLKKVAPKLGLLSGQAIADANDPHSSAAVAMAGLAGHAIDGTGQWAPDMMPPVPTDTPEPISGQQISFELMNLFETACSYGEAMISKHADFMLENGTANGEMPGGGPESFSGMWGQGEEFVKAFKDCL